MVAEGYDMVAMQHAFATLRWSPGKTFLNGVAAQALNCIGRFKPQEVSAAPLSLLPHLHSLKFCVSTTQFPQFCF